MYIFHNRSYCPNFKYIYYDIFHNLAVTCESFSSKAVDLITVYVTKHRCILQLQ